MMMPVVMGFGWGKAPEPVPPPKEGLDLLMAKLAVDPSLRGTVVATIGVAVLLILLLLVQAGGGGDGFGGRELLRMFLGQEKKRGINVNDWIGEYNSLVCLPSRTTQSASWRSSRV